MTAVACKQGDRRELGVCTSSDAAACARTALLTTYYTIYLFGVSAPFEVVPWIHFRFLIRSYY